MNYIYLNQKKMIIKSILSQLKQKDVLPVLIIQSKNKNALISVVIKNNIKSIAILRTMRNKRYNRVNVDFSWSLINDYFIRVNFFKENELSKSITRN